jgi:phytoene synthase
LDAINEWECAYNTAFEIGESTHPVLRAYLRTAQECGIPQDVMNDYFRAMRDDLSVTRFATFNDLLHYMGGSAIPVGRAMTYILGVKPPYVIEDALPGADALSIAMQLSNFWRDVGYDWRIGRVYLPQEDMARFNVTEADLAAGQATPNLVRLLEFEFERTEAYYRQARASVALLAEGRWAVMSGLEVYRAILFGIRRNRYDVFNTKAGTDKWQKLSLAARAWFQTR